MHDSRNIFTFEEMIEKLLKKDIVLALEKLYKIKDYDLQFQKTRKEFDGDITLVIFPFTKFSKKSPQETGNEIGEILNLSDFIYSFNVVKGFLNLVINDDVWLALLSDALQDNSFGFINANKDDPTYLVEYCSPNTNKPLHLGHIRNNLLGFSLAEILKASGKNVQKVQIINDRGIHICKSMVAWQEFGNNETPETNNFKGDHLVGKYYVQFDKEYKSEIAEMIKNGTSKKEAEKLSPIFIKAQDMLLKWEAKDPDVIALWKKMNSWVYNGFAQTHKRLGVNFDKNYFESETYLLGKEVVKSGLDSGVFFKKPDGSVWIDLSDEGLDEKIILRSDGTSVYMTQDIGTAIKRHEDFNFSHMTYTVGNEQDYHFKVLFKILNKLGYAWSTNLYHLSYGMVDLPSGKMKSREGTVVDADELINEMKLNASNLSKELGKIDDFSSSEKDSLNTTISLGALKYFILKVDPKKRILFDPDESIDFNGNTGPFIQYAYARIQSLKRKAKFESDKINLDFEITQKEKNILKQLTQFPLAINTAAENFSPALIANYTFELVKLFNSYYQSTIILKIPNLEIKNFRLTLSDKVGQVIKSSMKLLGVEVPEKM